LLGTKDYVVVVVVVGGCYTGEDAEQWDDERDC
jgi:hypothetical protein